MIEITGGKGFHMTFENGLTVSVQFGFGNLCSNCRSVILNTHVTHPISCSNAEVAVWDKNDLWVTNKFCKIKDDVIGYVSADDVAKIIAKVQKYKGE